MLLQIINGAYTEASILYINFIMRKYNLNVQDAIDFINTQEDANAEIETNGSET